MIQEKYINLFTDFGFKRVFGQDANKDILKDFLNSVLPDKYQVEELQFSKNEATGVSMADRKAIFDLHCMSSEGERFIVELQKAKQQFFKDRSLFYSTFPITEQAKRGEWNYRLEPVFLIGILNFSFDHSDPEDIRHHVQLKDQNCEVFYEKLHFIYLEVVKFKKTLQECENRFEKWLWVFKNLPSIEELPTELMGDMLSKVFHIAEVANLDADERAAYRDSLKYMRDLHNVVETAYVEGVEEGLEQGLERGLEQGLEKGRKEGRQLGLLDAACRMRAQGIGDHEIARILGLSGEELEALECEG